METRIRAIAEEGTNVGQERHLLFKQAYGRINHSMENGYYLEAITIIESLVSDRLESRLTFLKGTDFSFKNLGQLINAARNDETDDELKTLIIADLDSWREKRNTSLHEMAKKADGDASTWEDRVADIKQVAIDGLDILRKIDNKCTKLRRSHN